MPSDEVKSGPAFVAEQFRQLALDSPGTSLSNNAITEMGYIPWSTGENMDKGTVAVASSRKNLDKEARIKATELAKMFETLLNQDNDLMARIRVVARVSRGWKSYGKMIKHGTAGISVLEMSA